MTMFSPPSTLGRVHAPVSDAVGLRTVEMALNVALFVPLGGVLGWLGSARWLPGLVLLSVGIEVAQLWLPDRNSEVIDVVSNSLGGLLGYAGVSILLRQARTRRRSSLGEEP